MCVLIALVAVLPAVYLLLYLVLHYNKLYRAWNSSTELFGRRNGCCIIGLYLPLDGITNLKYKLLYFLTPNKKIQRGRHWLFIGIDADI